MKTFQIIALALSIALALAACNKDNDPAADRNIVRVTPSIAATRAAIDEADGTGRFEPGDVIGVYATPTDPQTFDISRIATFNGTAWEYNIPLRWSDLPEDQSGLGYFIIGHYPVQTATPDKYGNITFSVRTDQSTAAAYRVSDLLVSGTISGYGMFLPVFVEKGETVMLNFVHVMSRIKVRLTAGNNVSPEEVNNATVKIKNAQVNYMISLINGSNGEPDSKSHADITPLKSATSPGTFYAVVPRQPLAAGNDWIEITAGGNIATYKVPSNTFLYCGETQQVNLTLSRSQPKSANVPAKSAIPHMPSGDELILECTSVN